MPKKKKGDLKRYKQITEKKHAFSTGTRPNPECNKLFLLGRLKVSLAQCPRGKALFLNQIPAF